MKNLYLDMPLGEDAAPSLQVPKDSKIPGEVYEFGAQAIRTADSAYSKGYHDGYQSRDESQSEELWTARIVGVIVGALGTSAIGLLLVATKAIVIRWA